MKNNSIWVKGIKNNKCSKLQENIETDILIIGGGITGISTAFHLKDSKYKVTLVDSNKCGYGITSRTTGKLTFLQDNVYTKISNIYGNSTALKYYNSQIEAIELVKNIIIDNNINCNFECNSSYLFGDTNKEIKKIKKEESFFIKNSIPYKRIDHLPIPFDCKYGIKVDNTAVFHPLKYVLSLKDICLKSGLDIYENTEILNIVKQDKTFVALTKNNTIRAKYIVLACHYPFKLMPTFPFKTYIEKSFACAGLVKKNKMFNAINVGKQTHSIRYHSDSNDYLIYVGQSKTLDLGMNNDKDYLKLFWKMKSSLCPDIKYCWNNYDIMTLDHMPVIGEHSKNVFVATGFNTWGMTNGTLAGKLLSDIILHKDNSYKDLFDPNRKASLVKAMNMILYSLKNGKAFIKSKLQSQDSNVNVRTFRKNGKKYGVYTDEKNKEHIVYTTCPHMKCDLVFNNVDKTWDCPCHGSRYTFEGKLIYGPSKKDLKIID